MKIKISTSANEGALKAKVEAELKRFLRFKDDFDAFVTELQRMQKQLSPTQDAKIPHIEARVSDLEKIGDAVQKLKNEQDFG
jgi:hypothetical protein